MLPAKVSDRLRLLQWALPLGIGSWLCFTSSARPTLSSIITVMISTGSSRLVLRYLWPISCLVSVSESFANGTSKRNWPKSRCCG